VRFSSCDGCERVDKCSDEGTCTDVLRTFRNSSTRSHASEGENRTIEIAAKIASLNGHEILSKTQYLFFS
jgi:hypothetical protein